jgi:hypothetical protein
MAAKKTANKAAKANKANSTILTAGKAKKDNTMDGAKSTPAYKKFSAVKAAAKTFTNNKKMKKPTK